MPQLNPALPHPSVTHAACLTVPLVTDLAGDNQNVPDQACHATPNLTLPRLPWHTQPCLPYLSTRNPNGTDRVTPDRTKPAVTEPAEIERAEPLPNAPYRFVPSLPFRTVPSPVSPDRA